jgi:hypothetical protein
MADCFQPILRIAADKELKGCRETVSQVVVVSFQDSADIRVVCANEGVARRERAVIYGGNGFMIGLADEQIDHVAGLLVCERGQLV